MQLLTRQYVIIISVWFALAGILSAQQPETAAPSEPNIPSPEQLKPTATGTIRPPEKLFSPSVSQLFYNIAYDLSRGNIISESNDRQAMVFLDAANELDSTPGLVPADLLAIASRPGATQNLSLLYNILLKYINKNSDTLIASNAIRYILAQTDSREQKEKLISRLLVDLGDSNLYIKSELLTILGLLDAEKADDANAAMLMAMAYNANRYNRLAYEKLAELVPEQITPVLNLQYLRLNLRQNPLDLVTSQAFARYALRVQLYELAAGSYEYTADLYRFLYPGQQMPAEIYIEWMTSCYNINVPRMRLKCIQLADQFRSQGRFDIQIEALASRAAQKTGQTELSQQILESAEKKAIDMLVSPGSVNNYESLAWFYTYIKPDANKALDFANKSFSKEPNSPLSAALLAYALADNNQPDSAKSLLENFPRTQVASFVQAKINLAANDKQAALDSLRLAVDKDPGSLVAEQALEMLKALDADYIPIFDTTLMLNTLEKQVGGQLTPHFIPPEQILSFLFNVRGTRFIYGSDFTGVVTITNNWFEPLVISDAGFLGGRISVDAEVSGDIEAKFTSFVSVTTRPTNPLAPGQSIVIPVRLFSGKLKKLLVNHPQASANIRFTAYLDPVINPVTKAVTCQLPGIKPAVVEIERPRVDVTPDFLQNRFDSLTRGKQGPKIKAAQLFAGLLAENEENPSYRHVRAEWMAPMLRSGVIQALADSDWVVRVHTLAALADINLDYDLLNAASGGINDRNWPARMTALWVLASKQDYGFGKVLDYAARHDESVFVKSMSLALGAKRPVPAADVDKSLLDLLKQDPNSPVLPF